MPITFDGEYQIFLKISKQFFTKKKKKKMTNIEFDKYRSLIVYNK